MFLCCWFVSDSEYSAKIKKIKTTDLLEKIIFLSSCSYITFTFRFPFQLFEMGLELSFSRLKALAKFAFGMGLTQVICLQKEIFMVLAAK